MLEGELSAAQQAAKQAPSRTMKSLVEKLRNQLSLKEKQQRVRITCLLLDVCLHVLIIYNPLQKKNIHFITVHAWCNQVLIGGHPTIDHGDGI